MPDKIKVCMVTRDYISAVGGIPTHVSGLVSGLKKWGVEVDVLEGRGDVRTLFLARAERTLSSDYDLVHVQSLPYGALVRRHPFVLTAHSPTTEEGAYYGTVNRLKMPFASMLERRAIGRADRIIAVSRLTFDQLVGGLGAEPTKVRVIRSGVDTDGFNPSGKSNAPPQKVLVCSRLDPRKNIAEALEALRAVSEGYQLAVVGDGPERQRLEDMARRLPHHAFFLGRVSEKELRDNFSFCNIFLSTSLQEGFGSSLLQAMAAGCAPLVSDIPAHRELVENGVDGFIYKSHDELVRLLNQLLSDPDLTRRLGIQAREKSLGYSWDRVAEETATLYREALGG